MNAIEWVELLQSLDRKSTDSSEVMLKRLFPFKFKLMRNTTEQKQLIAEATDWLLNNATSDEYVWLASTVHFKDDVVAMQFRLTFTDIVSS
jgi:hypothetical protein